jgi:ParB/RepB/Spo0J family partition protein
MPRNKIKSAESQPILEIVAIDKIVGAPANPNTMDTVQLEALVRSIKELGFLAPIVGRLIKDDVVEVVDGHHRLLAAKKAGMQNIPVMLVESLDDAHVVVASVALNRLRGELSLSTVASMLGTLHAGGWTTEELALSGFTTDEVADMLTASNNISTEDLLEGSDVSLPEPEEKESECPFVLELPFKTREEMVAIRRRLKGVGDGDMSVGLLKILALD